MRLAVAVALLGACSSDSGGGDTTYVTVRDDGIAITRISDSCDPTASLVSVPVNKCGFYGDVPEPAKCPANRSVTASVEDKGTVVASADATDDDNTFLMGKFLGDTLVIEDERVPLPTTIPAIPRLFFDGRNVGWDALTPTQVFVTVDNAMDGKGCRVPATTNRLPAEGITATIVAEIETKQGTIVVRATSAMDTE